MRILDSDAPALSLSSAAPVVAIGRLLWAGPLTILTSLAAVHATRLVAVRIFAVAIRISGMNADQSPLGWIAPTADTAILVAIALGVFASISGSADRPIRTWRWLAFGALLVSFVPLVLMERGPLIGSAATAAALGAMHIAAYVPCVTLLPWLTTTKREIGASL